ncbi:hypothetical protein BIV60_21470 [Bacillus sp. MUM 116]|nr:hypothetical protein BIV60_21470 [Bacillus sp. MUM 116]
MYPARDFIDQGIIPAAGSDASVRGLRWLLILLWLLLLAQLLKARPMAENRSMKAIQIIFRKFILKSKTELAHCTALFCIRDVYHRKLFTYIRYFKIMVRTGGIYNAFSY